MSGFHGDTPTAGTYYLVLQNYGSGTATGTYDIWWRSELSMRAGSRMG